MIIFQLLDECLKYIFFICINLKQKLFEGGGGGGGVELEMKWLLRTR